MNIRRPNSALILAGSIAAFLAGQSAQADIFDNNSTTLGFGVTNGSTYDWLGASLWSDGTGATNDAGTAATVTWQGTSGVSEQAYFVGSGTAGQNYTVRLGSTGATDTYIQNFAINVNAAGSAALTGAAGDVTIGNTGDAGKLILRAANSVGAQGGGTLTVNNGINLNAVTMNFRGGNMVINGSVSGTGTSHIASGSGAFSLSSGTLTLAGDNSFAGNVSVASAYIFSLQHANALGAAGGTNTVSSGGSMEVAGGVTIVSGESVSINGDGASSFGALRAGTGGGTWAGGVTLATAARLGATAGNTLTVTGSISGGAGIGFNISGQSGTGVVILNPTGTNTYSGTTGIVRGILRLGKTDALPTGTTLDVDSAAGVTDAATFDLASFSQTVAVLQDTATTNINGKITNSVVSTISTLTVNQASGTDYGGIIENGSGSVVLTKGGAGALTLSGANTFTGGTNIKNGIIIISGGNDRLATGGSVVLGDAGTSGKLVVGTSTTERSQTLAGLTITGSGGSVVGAHATNNSTLTLNIASGTNTFAGTLGGGGTNENKLALIKAGVGTLSLTNSSNSFTGNVTLNAQSGTLRITNSTALGVGPKTVTNTGASNLVPVTGANLLELDSNGGADISLASNISFTTSGAAGVVLNTAGNNTIAGNFNMTVGNGNTKIISNGGTLTLSGTYTSNATDRELDLSGSTTGNIFSGALVNGSNTALLTKSGAGTWEVSGALNTFTGRTKVTGGTLKLTDNLAIKNSAFDTSGAGALDVTTVNTPTIGGLIGDSGTGQNFVLPANVTSLTLNPTVAATTNTYVKDISGGAAGLTLTKSGAGTQILNGTSSYTGLTTVSGGVLTIGNNAGLGTTAGETTVTAGSLRLANGVTVTGETISIAGTGSDFNGALQADAGATAEWAGTVKINSATARVGAGIGGTLKLSGAIVDNAGFPVLNIGPGTGGTGTVIVSAASGTNTYTGNTTITRGTLKLGADNTLPTGSILDVDTANAGENAIFDLAGFNQTVAGLQRTGSGSGAGGSFITNSGAADKTLTINQASTTTYSGTIQDGGTNKTIIVKDGVGTLTLSGANTFTGATTIDGGALEVSGASSLSGTVNVTVNTGGTLLLSGNGGTNAKLNPLATMELAGGTLEVSDTIGSTLDQTLGTLTLSASSIIDFGTFASGNTFRFADSASLFASWSGTLSIHNWTDGADHLFFGNGSGTGLEQSQLDQIKFFSDAGSTILPFAPGYSGFTGSFGEVTPVPEPSSVATVMGLLGLVGWRERRKAHRARRATQNSAI